MDQKECAAYFDSAVAQLEEAKIALDHKRYALVAFLSAMSAENSTSSLIISLGSRPSKKHRNSLVLHRLSSSVGEPLRSKLLELISRMKKLEPHATKARYPVRKGTEFVPPVGFYTAGTATELFRVATEVMKLVKDLSAKVAKVRTTRRHG